MNAKLYCPYGVFVSNGEVFIADTSNHRVRKLLRNGQIVTIAGTGIAGGYNDDDQLAVDAQLCLPHGLFVTEDEEVFFCDYSNHRVRKIDRNGTISTIAGNGEEGYNGDDILATDAKLNGPKGVFVHKNEIYIADCGNSRIRKVLQNGMITTIAGTGVVGYNGDDQPATSAKLRSPSYLFIHNDRIYISDCYNHRVRMILPNGTITTIAGTGKCGFNGDGNLPIESQLEYPEGIFVDDSGIYFCTSSRIRKIDPTDIITTIVGTGEHGYSGDVPFDFEKYPHIGPRKKQLIKPFPKSYHDIAIHFND